jgi:hypothetical protein
MAEILPLRKAISGLLHDGDVVAMEATGWPVRFADMIKETPPPTERELETLRDLEWRTAIAHGRGSAKAEEGRGSLAPRK